MATLLSDPDKVLTPRQTSDVTSLSNTTIWRLRKAKDFPKAVPLSAGRVGFRAGDLAQWLETRGAAAAHA